MKDLNRLPKDAPSDPLGTALSGWKVNPQVSPRFQAEVWQKIAARETQSTRLTSRVRRALEWISLGLMRPQFAAVLILVSGIAGGSAARWKAGQVNARTFKALESQYIASIDPYAHLAAHGASMEIRGQ